MITLVIDDKSQEAKKMMELLKTRPYAKIIKEPNIETLKAIKDAEEGKLSVSVNYGCCLKFHSSL